MSITLEDMFARNTIPPGDSETYLFLKRLHGLDFGDSQNPSDNLFSRLERLKRSGAVLLNPIQSNAFEELNELFSSYSVDIDDVGDRELVISEFYADLSKQYQYDLIRKFLTKWRALEHLTRWKCIQQGLVYFDAASNDFRVRGRSERAATAGDLFNCLRVQRSQDFTTVLSLRNRSIVGHGTIGFSNSNIFSNGIQHLDQCIRRYAPSRQIDLINCAVLDLDIGTIVTNLGQRLSSN